MKITAFPHVLIVILYVCVISSRGQNGYIEAINGQQDVRLEQLPGNDHERFPETFSVWFQYGEDLVFYELLRDDVVTNSLSAVLFRLSSYLPDDLMTDDNIEHFAFYHNNESLESKSRAHFVIYRPDSHSQSTFYGQVVSEDVTYKIIPSKDKSNIYRVTSDNTYENDRLRPDLPVPGNSNVIELFVWCAPDLYEFHLNRLSLSPADVEEWLQTYVRSLTRDVDLVFRSITLLPLRVYFVNGGSDRSSESTRWYADNDNGNSLDAGRVLKDVTEYLTGKVKSGLIPTYDHAVVLTRKQLFENIEEKPLKIAFGNKNSICTGEKGSSVSLASVGSSSFLNAIVQSIGIGFGLEDIGDYQTNTNREYTGLERSSESQRMQFSWSGQFKIKKHLMNEAKTCLTTETSDMDFVEFLNSPRFEDYQYQSLETQCEVIYGANSENCLGCRSGKCLYRQKASGSLSLNGFPESNIAAPSTVSSVPPFTDISTIPPISSTFEPGSSTIIPYSSSFEPSTITAFSSDVPDVSTMNPMAELETEVSSTIVPTFSVSSVDPTFSAYRSTFSVSTDDPEHSSPLSFSTEEISSLYPSTDMTIKDVIKSFPTCAVHTGIETRHKQDCECCRQCMCEEVCKNCPNERSLPQLDPRSEICNGDRGCCTAKGRMSFFHIPVDCAYDIDEGSRTLVVRDGGKTEDIYMVARHWQKEDGTWEGELIPELD